MILGQVVRELQHSRNGVTVKTEDGSVYEANYVISSVSIGVLKSQLISFNPPLPVRLIMLFIYFLLNFIYLLLVFSSLLNAFRFFLGFIALFSNKDCQCPIMPQQHLTFLS